jgi:hypothetical protein
VISTAEFGAASAEGFTRSAAGDAINQAATATATSEYRLDGMTRAEDGVLIRPRPSLKIS